MMARNASHNLLRWTLLASLAFMGACKAKPAQEPSAFLGDDPKLAAQQDDLYPFHKIWLSPAWNDASNRTLVVLPVHADFVKKSSWWAKANMKGGDEQMAKDLQNLATFTQEKFQEAFRADKNKRFQVVASAQGDSLVFELALVDVIPNKAALGALGLAATVLAAPVGVAIAAKETGKGSVAIEGRIRDASTGQIVGMWADRETGKFAPINLRRATWYGEAHKIIEEWAGQWVKIANADAGEKVKDTRTFTLMPW